MKITITITRNIPRKAFLRVTSMEKISLDYLNLFMSNGDVSLENQEDIETGLEISPREYLRFAEYDLNANYDHHLVNSLSNSKRAIDSQLDSLLIGFGLSKRAAKWKFPAKVNYLNDIGIISPRILNKINKKRNFLEHEYKKPNAEEVEDALDVAVLFINYTNKYLFPAAIEFVLHDKEMGYYGYSEDTKMLIIRLDWRNCKLIFNTPVRGTNGLWEYITEDVSSGHKDYDEYLKIFISFYNEIYH